MVATAPMSNAAMATSMTITTPAITRSRSCARHSRRSSALGLIVILLAGQPQTVADGALGVDQVLAGDRKLAPQVGHVSGHDRARAAEVVVPHVLEELDPAQHPARVEHEVAQQPELRRGQLDEPTAAAHLIGVL